MPKVSVIIITYNRSELLSTAITSVLNQTYRDFEIIVVDDASEDDTAQVVEGFNDIRIRYIRHETNQKEAGARNTGLRSSRGQYIAFLDDDDIWLPAKLKMQVDFLDRSSPVVGGLYTGFLKIDRANGKTLGQLVPTKRGNIFQDMLIRNWVGTPSTVLIRNECFKKVGLFDEEFATGTDYDMWLRISKEFAIDYIREPLVLYRIHGNQMSTSHEAHIRGVEAQLRKHASILAKNSKSYSRRYLALGVHYCYEGNVLKGREAFFKAIRIYPFAIRCYYNLCLSLLGAKNFRQLKTLRDRNLFDFRGAMNGDK